MAIFFSFIFLQLKLFIIKICICGDGCGSVIIIMMHPNKIEPKNNGEKWSLNEKNKKILHDQPNDFCCCCCWLAIMTFIVRIVFLHHYHFCFFSRFQMNFKWLWIFRCKMVHRMVMTKAMPSKKKSSTRIFSIYYRFFFWKKNSEIVRFCCCCLIV